MPQDTVKNVLERMIDNVEDRIAKALDAIDDQKRLLTGLYKERRCHQQQLKKHLDSPDNTG